MCHGVCEYASLLLQAPEGWLSICTEHLLWSGGLQAKRKYQEALAAKQQLDVDNQELQQKYSQKAM